jgi:hypothetical protein
MWLVVINTMQSCKVLPGDAQIGGELMSSPMVVDREDLPTKMTFRA